MMGLLHVSASTWPSSGGLQQRNTIMAVSVKDVHTWSQKYNVSSQNAKNI
jgi:hypothetical protein